MTTPQTAVKPRGIIGSWMFSASAQNRRPGRPGSGGQRETGGDGDLAGPCDGGCHGLPRGVQRYTEPSVAGTAGLTNGTRCRHRTPHRPPSPATGARSRPSADGNGWQADVSPRSAGECKTQDTRTRSSRLRIRTPARLRQRAEGRVRRLPDSRRWGRAARAAPLGAARRGTRCPGLGPGWSAGCQKTTGRCGVHRDRGTSPRHARLHSRVSWVSAIARDRQCPVTANRLALGRLEWSEFSDTLVPALILSVPIARRCRQFAVPEDGG